LVGILTPTWCGYQPIKALSKKIFIESSKFIGTPLFLLAGNKGFEPLSAVLEAASRF
jgi:hypothetical protein